MERGPCASAALFVLGFLPLAALARAAPREPAAPAGARPFHLSYDASAPSGPDAPAFRAAIRARTDRARLAGEREKATTFAVRITAGPDERVVGELTIHEPDGAPRVRTMESETCGDVARAIALVVALVLDPDADTSADPPLPVPDGPDGRDAPRPPPASPPPTANPSSAATGPPPSPAPATVRVGVGGAIGVLGGVGPSVAPLAGAFVEAERAGAGPSWFRPTARLAVDLATVAGDHGVGSQRYLWLAATARVCPVQLPVGTSVRVGPCVGMQAGRHQATTSDLPNARTSAKPWLAPTATVSLAWRATGRVTLELQGGIVVPLVRTRFFLAPDVTLFRVPAVTGMAAASAIVHFR